MTTFKIPEHLRYDKRMIERNLQNGELTPGQLDKHLGALSDVEHNAETVVLEEDMPVEAVVVEPAFGGESYSSESSYADPAASSFSDSSFTQSAPAPAEPSPPAYVAPTPAAPPAAVPFAAAPTPAAPTPAAAAPTPVADPAPTTSNPFGGSTPSSEPGDPGVG